MCGPTQARRQRFGNGVNRINNSETIELNTNTTPLTGFSPVEDVELPIDPINTLNSRGSH